MDAILELLLVLTGKGLVWALSLGRWRGEKLSRTAAGVHAAAGSLSFVLDGQRVITAAGLTLVAIVFYGVALGALVYWTTTA